MNGKTVLALGLVAVGIYVATRKPKATDAPGGSTTGNGTKPSTATPPIVPTGTVATQSATPSTRPTSLKFKQNGVETIFTVGDPVLFGGVKYTISAIFSSDTVELSGIGNSSRFTQYAGYLKKV